jgi:AcrR family transcriptional regulator
VQGEFGDRQEGTRARLLEAAGYFGQASYHEVGIARILERAKVHPPTLYYHFGDKEGLYVEWALRAIDELGSTIRMALSLRSSVRDGLSAMSSTLADSAHPDFSKFLSDATRLEKPQSRERIVEAVQRAIYEPLYALVLSGMENGEIRPEPVQKTATVFLAGSLGLRRDGPLGTGEDSSAEWWVERFLDGFGPMAK